MIDVERIIEINYNDFSNQIEYCFDDEEEHTIKILKSQVAHLIGFEVYEKDDNDYIEFDDGDVCLYDYEFSEMELKTAVVNYFYATEK